MTAALALLSALTVGASDFLASIASRKSRAEVVPFLTHVVSMGFLLVSVWFIAAPKVTIGDLGWGASGGATGALGLYLFLRSMSLGQISVVAPAAAVSTSVTTVVFGTLGGDRPAAINIVGIVLAVAAGATISSVASDNPGSDIESNNEPNDGAILHRLEHLVINTSTSLRVLAESALAGVMFGWFFVSLSFTSDDAGLWPLVTARMVSIPLLGILALGTLPEVRPYRRLWVERDVLTISALAGALEMVASVLLLLALRRGPLSVAGVVGSLYPVSTVLLASLALREKLQTIQWIAVALALIAVPLTSW